MAKGDGRGSNRPPPGMNQADNPMRRNQGVKARQRVSRRAVICALFACLIATTMPATVSDARQASAAASAISPQAPPCLAKSVFFQGLPKTFRWPDADDALPLRVLKEYGAMFVAREGVALPPVLIFPGSAAVAQWQSSVSSESAEIAGIPMRLQVAAMHALQNARDEAAKAHVAISPQARDGAMRTYEETLDLWSRYVNVGLRWWVGKGSLSAAEADRIRKLPPGKQVPEILDLEARGLYFGNNPSKSILSSVAPPGASQHLSMLAFDVKEHNNPVVRSILAHHGWYQTVRSDLPHFTYLGVEEGQLPSLGLKMVKSSGRVFWVPDFECPR